MNREALKRLNQIALNKLLHKQIIYEGNICTIMFISLYLIKQDLGDNYFFLVFLEQENGKRVYLEVSKFMHSNYKSFTELEKQLV